MSVLVLEGAIPLAEKRMFSPPTFTVGLSPLLVALTAVTRVPLVSILAVEVMLKGACQMISAALRHSGKLAVMAKERRRKEVINFWE